MFSKFIKKSPNTSQAPAEATPETPHEITAEAAWENRLKAAIGNDAELLALAMDAQSVDHKFFAVTFSENDRYWADGRWVHGMLEFTNGKLDNCLHDSLWPSGGSSAIRRDLWNKLGGFDPIFSPGYSEDLDLGLRAHTAGYKIIWDPNRIVSHTPETSFNKAFPPRRLQYIKERNYLLAMWKNMPSGLWSAHLSSLLGRILGHPGYIVPTLWALWKKLVS